MQVALGRRGDYSVRAMLALARAFGDGRRKARQIATTMDIPARYLSQIMAPLVRQHLVLATAGPDGGYELTRPPASITLLEVIEAAEVSSFARGTYSRGDRVTGSRSVLSTMFGLSGTRRLDISCVSPPSSNSPRTIG